MNQEYKKTLPLYKELDSKRTQGELDCGYGKISNAYGIFTKKMLNDAVN